MAVILQPPKSGLQEGVSALSKALEQRAKNRLEDPLAAFNRKYFGEDSQPQVEQQQPDGPLDTTLSNGVNASQPSPQPKSLDEMLKNIPDEAIMALASSKDPAARSVAKIINDRKLASEKATALRDKETRKEDRDIRKEDRSKKTEYSKPFNDIAKLKSKANRMEHVITQLAEGDISLDETFWSTTASALAGDMGFEEAKQLFKTEGQKKMFSTLRPMFDTREIGGSNPSTREMLTTLSTLPSGLNQKDTNEFIALLLGNEANNLVQQAEIVADINKNSPDLTWGDFQSQVNERISPIIEKSHNEVTRLSQMHMARKMVKEHPAKWRHTWILDPKGIPREVPNDQVNASLKAGGRKVNGS